MRYLIALLLLISPVAYAQDVLSISDSTDGTITTITYSWTSDGSGNATGATSVAVPGVVFAARTSVSAVAQPTNLYDVVVYQQFTDVDGGSDVVASTDLFDGDLLNRPNTTNSVQLVNLWPDTVQTCSGKIRIQVSNAGPATKGIVQVQVARNLRIQRGDANIPMTSGASGQILQYLGPGQAKFVTASGEATIADGGAINLQGSPDFTEVNTGVDDTTGGVIRAYGGAGNAGGIVNIYNGANQDSTVDRWSLFGYSNGSLAIIPGTDTFRHEFETDGDILTHQDITAGRHLIATQDLRNTRFFSLGSSSGGAVTIASGVITPSRTNQQVDTEGAAASDDLDTITGTGLQGGTLFIIRSVSSTRDVVIKHGTGNIRCLGSADITLGNTTQRALIMWDAGLSLFTATQLF